MSGLVIDYLDGERTQRLGRTFGAFTFPQITICTNRVDTGVQIKLTDVTGLRQPLSPSNECSCR